jgi:hypothetical protein
MKKLISISLFALFLATGIAGAQQTVRQSGNITPGHISCWITIGVIIDCGASFAGGGNSVVGPNISIANDFVCWANTFGNIISGCGGGFNTINNWTTQIFTAAANNGAVITEGGFILQTNSSPFQNLSVISTAANDIFGLRIYNNALNGQDWRVEQGRSNVGDLDISRCPSTCTSVAAFSADGTTITTTAGLKLPSTAMPIAQAFAGVGSSATGLASLVSLTNASSLYKFEWNTQLSVSSNIGGAISSISTITYNSGSGLLTLTFASAPYGADLTGPIGTDALVYNITGGFANGAWPVASISNGGLTVVLQAQTGLGSLTLSGGSFTPTANKGALYAAGVCSAGSSDCYAANFIASAGSGFLHTTTGLEIDVNNGAQNYGAVRWGYDGGVTPQQWGLVLASSSAANNSTSFVSTAGIYLTALASSGSIGGGAWRYGMICDTLSVATACLFDPSYGTNSYLMAGTHTTGINMSGATLTVAMLLPNNVPIQQTDSTSAAHDLIYLNGSNVVQIGDASYGAAVKGLTVTGSFTATGLVTNADLVNAATTVGGATCTLGSTCLGTATGSGNVVLATSPTISGLTVTGSLTATGLISPSSLAAQNANTVLGNGTGSSASPTALAVNSCSATGDALLWTSGTGFGCATGYAPLASPTFTTSATAPEFISNGATNSVTMQMAQGGSIRELSTSGGAIYLDVGFGSGSTTGTLYLRYGASATQAMAVGSSGLEFLVVSSAAQSNVLCWNSSTGLVTYQSATNCNPSALRYKNLLKPTPLDSTRLGVLRTNQPWAYKPGDLYENGRAHVGLLADDVEAMDWRCVTYENGLLQNYEDRCVIAYLVAARQADRAEFKAYRENHP